jgi:hypothetical protein
MFEPGQKVICVDDRFPPGIHDFFSALPVKGREYTVRDLVPGQDWALNGQPAVYLVELRNLPNQHGIEPGFACRRFTEATEITQRESERHKMFA